MRVRNELPNCAANPISFLVCSCSQACAGHALCSSFENEMPSPVGSSRSLSWLCRQTRKQDHHGVPKCLLQLQNMQLHCLTLAAGTATSVCCRNNHAAAAQRALTIGCRLCCAAGIQQGEKGSHAHTGLRCARDTSISLHTKAEVGKFCLIQACLRPPLTISRTWCAFNALTCR